jgi:hypothetical protein
MTAVRARKSRREMGELIGRYRTSIANATPDANSFFFNRGAAG